MHRNDAGRATETATAARCPLLTDILRATHCTRPFNEQAYHEFQTRYLNTFYEHILRKELRSCLHGNIQIAVKTRLRTPSERHRRYRQGQYEIREILPPTKYEWAKPIRSDVLVDECRGRDRAIIPVLLLMGDYQSQRTSGGQLEHEYENAVRSGGHPRQTRRRGPNPDLWSGHYTVVLVDYRNRTLEYFEPNGSGVEWLTPVVPVLRGMLEKTFPGWRFVDPADFCPEISVQSLTETATCAYWSSLWGLLRVACPGTSREGLLDVLVGKGKRWLNELLRRFHCYMWTYAQDHRILAAGELLENSQDYVNRAWRRRNVSVHNALVKAYNRALVLFHDENEPEESYRVLQRALAVARGRERQS